MSAQELKRRVVAKLEEAAATRVNHLISQRQRPALQGSDGTVSPAATAEEIGLRTVELTAELRAIQLAVEAINGTYAEMTQAQEHRDGGVMKKPGAYK